MEGCYKPQYDMRLAKLEKLKTMKGMCEACGKTGDRIHHIDENKKNHNLDNLVLLCNKCHNILHSNRKNKTSKFVREYGMTISELAKSFHTTVGYIYGLHKRNPQELKKLVQK
jgi:hypothetical protein